MSSEIARSITACADNGNYLNQASEDRDFCKVK